MNGAFLNFHYSATVPDITFDRVVRPSIFEKIDDRSDQYLPVQVLFYGSAHHFHTKKTYTRCYFMIPDIIFILRKPTPGAESVYKFYISAYNF